MVASADIATCPIRMRIWKSRPRPEAALANGRGLEEPSTGPGATIMPLDVEHVLLHLLVDNGGPLGSGALIGQLEAIGYAGSEPTIGRFLRKLDRRGLTRRVSNKGREVTDEGRRRLQQLCEAEIRQQYERELIQTTQTSTIDDILDVLVARRALERETARLAAQHATPEDLAQLDEAIGRQRQALSSKGIAVNADIAFHALLGTASRNRVLAAALALLRRDRHLTIVLDSILKQTSHTWVVGHEQILAAVKGGDPDAAERAMLEHINAVIADVRTYRDRLAQAPPRPGDTSATG